ncbi:LysM peptidoglycan-binding domain-containing protein [Frankia sp. Cppng1_Ct_nod]|uniref:LysM peptidoglycan-binding domain-containing protein n=1 Tax=Frankia sp. Cppng1_Ct_nod TaxID=2897162 RepID=UPI002024BC19|nr:LysM peptidoglycan-binding domain-containing protein [Frankia sp. Cppng1_Ct_nod]
MSAVRRLLAALTGSITTTALAIFMIAAGPRRTDFPPDISALPSWINADPEHALTSVVGLAAWACLLWLCLGFLLGALATLPGVGGQMAALVARRILPRTLRHIIEITLGVTLAAGTAVPALAASPTAGTGTTGAVTASATAWPDIDIQTTPTTLTATQAAPTPQLTPASLSSNNPDQPPATQARTGIRWPDLDPHDLDPRDIRPVAAAPASTPGPSKQTDPATFLDIRAVALDPTPTTATDLSPQPARSSDRPTDSSPTPTFTPTPAPAPGASAGAQTPWPDLDPHDTPPRDLPQPDPLVAPGSLGIGKSGRLPAVPSDTGVLNSSEVVVLRGDNLWAIAARHLPPGATAAQIAQEWPRWWAANEHVIGPDPDKILPGQRLQPPRPGP